MAQPDDLGAQPFQHAVSELHGSYRAQQTSHGPPDPLVSDIVSGRVLLLHLVRSAAFAAGFLLLLLPTLLVWLLVAVTELGPRSAPDSGTGGLSAFASLLALLCLLALVVWVVTLFFPVREPIAEYGLLIEGRAAAAPTAYEWVVRAASARASPFATRFAKVHGAPVLLLDNHREHCLIIVRTLGSDLYIGWTMWRARSTVVVVGHLFRDLVQQLRGADLTGDARAATSRALRELVHSLTREGAQATITQPPVAEQEARTRIAQLPELGELGAPPAPLAPPGVPPASAPPPTAPPPAAGSGPTQPSPSPHPGTAPAPRPHPEPPPEDPPPADPPPPVPPQRSSDDY